jgi:hypothetical protein
MVNHSAGFARIGIFVTYWQFAIVKFDNESPFTSGQRGPVANIFPGSNYLAAAVPDR